MACTAPPLQLAEALFQNAVEQSAIAIAITDTTARIVYVNRAFTAMTGYSADDVIGLNQSVLSYKTTPKAVYQELWANISAGRDWSGRLLNRRKDGTPYIAELTVTPVTSAAGERDVTHFLGMHRDVTKEYRQSCQLAYHKQLIESVVSVAPMAVALLDSEGKVVLDNPAYQSVVNDLKIKEPAHSVLTVLRENLGEAFDLAAARRRPLLNNELRFERPGAEPRWYSCSVAWFEEHPTAIDAFHQNAKSVYQLLLMHDISISKRQQEALGLALMRERLSENEYNQSVREALSGAVFQLQGPINLIAAATRLQRRRAGAAAVNDPLVRALVDAQEAGERAIATLQAAIPEELQTPVGPVNLNEIIRDVLMLETDTFLSAGVTVDWCPALILPSLQGDPSALRIVFRQLIRNAVEAMNTSGWSERNLHLSTSTRGGRIEAAISDTGPGIPEATRFKVFEPFFSTKRACKGARGMGLTVAQDVVSRHRGVLEIDPDYTDGCRLRLSFPHNHPPPSDPGALE